MLLKREVRGGKDRAYYTPYPLDKPIPKVSFLIAHPEGHTIFIDSVAMNHKGLNWKTYRKLAANNYKAFIYAFAYKIAEQPPLYPTSWQLMSNARRLEKFLKKEKIELSSLEQEIIKTCSRYRWYGLTNTRRETTSLTWQNDLAMLYLG